MSVILSPFNMIRPARQEWTGKKEKNNGQNNEKKEEKVTYSSNTRQEKIQIECIYLKPAQERGACIPNAVRVFFLMDNSSASSRTTFMYSSKPWIEMTNQNF